MWLGNSENDLLCGRYARTAPALLRGSCIHIPRAGDCLPITQPWAVPLIYLDGEAYVSGGLCCEKPWVKGQHGRCAHPMIEKWVAYGADRPATVDQSC